MEREVDCGRTSAHGPMGCQTDPSSGPIELFLITTSASRLVNHGLGTSMVCIILYDACKRTLAANQQE